MTRSALSDALAARGALHGKHRPKWMKGTFGTAIGPKIVDGKPTKDLAIQIVVRSKKPKSQVPRGKRIEETFEGIPLDVLRSRGELRAPPGFVPSVALPVGCGTAIVSSTGAFGTMACAGTTTDGRIVAIGSSHVAPDGSEVYRRADRFRLGRAGWSIDTVSGFELYQDWAKDPNERFLIDASAIPLEIAAEPGLPGGVPFRTAPTTLDLLHRLKESELLAYGGETGGWLQGFITGFWPQRTTRRVTGLCLVQPSPVPQRGDSGSLWLARLDSEFWAVGLHWGRVGSYAFVTDILSARWLLRTPALADGSAG